MVVYPGAPNSQKEVPIYSAEAIKTHQNRPMVICLLKCLAPNCESTQRIGCLLFCSPVRKVDWALLLVQAIGEHTSFRSLMVVLEFAIYVFFFFIIVCLHSSIWEFLLTNIQTLWFFHWSCLSKACIGREWSKIRGRKDLPWRHSRHLR